MHSSRVFFILVVLIPILLAATKPFAGINSNTDSLTLFHHKAGDANSIASDTLTGLYTDSKGRLWITNYGGISLFDPLHQSFTNYVPGPGWMHSKILMLTITIKEDTAPTGATQLKGLYYFNVNTKQFSTGYSWTIISAMD